MIEIEFSSLARARLQRGIPMIEKLEREVLALVNERHTKHIKTDWQFSVQLAHSKLKSHYVAVQDKKINFLIYRATRQFWF